MIDRTPVLYNQRALTAALELITGCNRLEVAVENDAHGPYYVVCFGAEHAGPLLRTFEGIPVRYTIMSRFQ